MKKLTMMIALLACCSVPLLASAADKAAPATPSTPAAPAAPSQADMERQLDDARARLQEDARRVADLSMQLNAGGMNPYYRDRQYGRHGHLGVDLTDTDHDADQPGATVAAVTPGGPADKAGLKEGDVITAINGTSFKSSDDESSGDKLERFMRDVKPGDSLTIAYTHDGKAATTKATAGDARDIINMRLPGMLHRPVLGIDVGRADSGNGVTLVGVTPDGPADKAGLRTGDVIVALNGTALKPDGDKSSGDALLAFMDKVHPGDKLKVDYSRDSKAASTSVTAVSPRDFFYSFRMPPIPPMPPMPAMPPMPPMPSFSGNGFGMFFGGGRWGELQLVPMNPGLSSYFGTDKGLLVLQAPKKSALQLQDGDVITGIGGRDPGSPSHAMRILGSYGPGESVKLDIMRKGKPVTLNVTLPKDQDDSSSSAFNFTLKVPDEGDDDADGR